jgi:hypothetical protein
MSLGVHSGAGVRRSLLNLELLHLDKPGKLHKLDFWIEVKFINSIHHSPRSMPL